MDKTTPPINGTFQVPSEFNIDKIFDKFLGLVNLDKRRMPPIQLKQLRQAFYGAWGMKLILDRDVMAAATMTDDEAVQVLENQLEQVSAFWNKEIAPDYFGKN